MGNVYNTILNRTFPHIYVNVYIDQKIVITIAIILCENELLMNWHYEGEKESEKEKERERGGGGKRERAWNKKML